MTSLGSTFVSEDPDSRGQPGATGETGATGATGDAGPDINTTKGDLAGFDTVSARIPVGTNGQVLEADSAQALGLKWADPAASTPTTTEGDVIQRGASADERLAIGTANQVLAVNSGATALEYVTPAAVSQVTTKGDLEGFSTVAARIPVGTDGQVLEADSAQALGLKWATPAGGAREFKYMDSGIDPADSGSSSTSAMKIQWLVCDTNVTVRTVIVGIEAQASQVYQVFIVEESATTPFEVAALTATSLALTNSASAQTRMTAHEFEFSSDFQLTAGKGYGICTTLTSAAIGTAARIAFQTDGQVPSPDFTFENASHIQKNTAPIATDDLTGTQLATNVIPCGFRYTRD